MKRTTLKVELGKDHAGKDVLVSLIWTPDATWPYRVRVEWDGKAHLPTDNGCRTRTKALEDFHRALGYRCGHREVGRPCRHFTPAARAYRSAAV